MNITQYLNSFNHQIFYTVLKDEHTSTTLEGKYEIYLQN